LNQCLWHGRLESDGACVRSHAEAPDGFGSATTLNLGSGWRQNGTGGDLHDESGGRGPRRSRNRRGGRKQVAALFCGMRSRCATGWWNPSRTSSRS